MRATIRDTEIYFDIEGSSLVVDGSRMREKPVAFLVHGGPGVAAGANWRGRIRWQDLLLRAR